MTSADTSVAICANKYQQPTLGKITISFQVCFLLPFSLCTLETGVISPIPIPIPIPDGPQSCDLQRS
jgi:hypothetical protein